MYSYLETLAFLPSLVISSSRVCLLDILHHPALSLVNDRSQEGVVHVLLQVPVLLLSPVNPLLVLHDAVYVHLGHGYLQELHHPSKLLLGVLHQVVVEDDQERALEVLDPFHVHPLPLLALVHCKLLPNFTSVLSELFQTCVTNVPTRPSVELSKNAVKRVSEKCNIN